MEAAAAGERAEAAAVVAAAAAAAGWAEICDMLQWAAPVAEMLVLVIAPAGIGAGDMAAVPAAPAAAAGGVGKASQAGTTRPRTRRWCH